MQKISFVECERVNGQSYIADTYDYIAIYDATGQVAPISAATTIYGVRMNPIAAAQVEADPNCLVHTDDNQFLDFDDSNPESHWRNELEAWLNNAP